MSMYHRVKEVKGEPLDYKRHPEYEVKDTRVSDYLRKYGTGHLDSAPQNMAPEIHDDRSVEEMLNDDFEPHMSTETVDVLMQIEQNRERFESAIKKMQLAENDKKRFDDAVAVLNNVNSSFDAKQEAYAILEELSSRGSVTRARKS